MANGNYHNQLYKEYEEAVTLNEELLTVLKKQTAQHKKDAEHMEQLENIIAKQKEKLDGLLEKNATLEKEVLRLNGLAKTGSSNSGLPTSQTPIQKKKHIPNTREKSGKKKGGQPGHQKAVLHKFEEEEINAQEVHEVTACPHCQGAVQETGIVRTKDELDYEVVLIKKRHYFPEYHCTHCHKKVRSAVPKQLKEENQYGGHVQSLALSFMNEANVSMNKTKKMIEGLTFGVIHPSEGYLAKLQKKAAKKLEGFAEDLRLHLLKQPLVYWDDTVISVNTHRSCLRFYGTEQLALYKAHPRKDLAGIQSDNLLALLPPETRVMHDHNKVNYNELFSYDNVECNVHLLRDLRKCTENTDHSWSKQLDELLVHTNVKRQHLIEQECRELSPVEEFRFFTDLDEAIVLGAEENQKDGNHYYHPTEKTLLKRLTEYRSQYFAWVTNFDVPFSNNLSERSLRGTKSKMKVAGQFQNTASAQCYALIKSYIETCYRHEINGIEALDRLIFSQPYTIEELTHE